MTPEEKRAYSKGYNAGDKWPEHKPPFPPEPIVRELMEALRSLRDHADSQCAIFEPDDEIVIGFDGPIQKADDAMARVGVWLREPKGRSKYDE